MTRSPLPLIKVRIKPHALEPLDEATLAEGVVAIDEHCKLLAVRCSLSNLMGSLNAIPGRKNLEYTQEGGEVLVRYNLDQYPTAVSQAQLFLYVASRVNEARIMSRSQTLAG